MPKGSVLRISKDELTLGDLEDFAKITGVSFQKAVQAKKVKDEDGNFVLDEDGQPITETDVSPTVLIALVYISKRKDDPAFSLADARNLKLAELVIDLGDEESDEESDPTTAN